MSGYGSDWVTVNCNDYRWLPIKPWNRQPMSPTLSLAKLRWYKDLALGLLSKSLTELPSRYYNQSFSSSPYQTDSSIVSYSSSAPMDRVTLSYPGTPTKSYGYHLQGQPSSSSAAAGISAIGSSGTLAIGYPRPNSVNLLLHPSNRYSPDTYPHYPQAQQQHTHGATWSLGLHRQSSSAYSTYSDRNYPPLAASTHQNYPHQHQQRDLLSVTPSVIARRNISLPIHHSSTSRSSSILPGLNYLNHRSPEPYNTNQGKSSTREINASPREQIKNGLKYFADERKRWSNNQNDSIHHSDHDLRYFNAPGLTSSSTLTTNPYTGYNYGHSPAGSHRSSVYSTSTRNRQHRSESDLEALFNLYSNVPDPVADRQPLPGVSRIGGVPFNDPLPNNYNQLPGSSYLYRNTSYPSIPLPYHSQTDNNNMHSASYPYHGSAPSVHPQISYQHHHQQHHPNPYHQHQSLDYSRCAQSNPYTVYPGYGSTTATHNRSNRSLDRYYH